MKEFLIILCALSIAVTALAESGEQAARQTFPVSVRMHGSTIIQSGAPVVLRGEDVGVVESVRAENAKTLVSVVLSESVRGLLKRGSVILLSMRKSRRVLELLIPDESKEPLDLNTPLAGYSSFEQYWLDVGQGKRER